MKFVDSLTASPRVAAVAVSAAQYVHTVAGSTICAVIQLLRHLYVSCMNRIIGRVIEHSN